MRISRMKIQQNWEAQEIDAVLPPSKESYITPSVMGYPVLQEEEMFACRVSKRNRTSAQLLLPTPVLL